LKKFTPAFVIVSTVSDDKVDWIKAGQLFERIWLTAEQAGLRCAPLAAPVQVKDYYKKLQDILEISFRPQIFSRMGYCDKIPQHSPRLAIDEVIRR